MRKLRLHKQVDPLVESKPVQPKPLIDAVSPSISREGYGKASSMVYPVLDADGHLVPEYW